MKITQADYMKAIHIGNRDAELAFEGGWKAKHKVHKSAKNYSRKDKHKNCNIF